MSVSGLRQFSVINLVTKTCKGGVGIEKIGS